MDDISDKTALVFDNGNFVSFAQRLAREFGHVMYYTPWNMQPYPASNDYLVGEGLDEIEKVESFWDVLDQADIIIFLDNYQGDLQTYLVEQGYRVWGTRYGEVLEMERMKNIVDMKKLGLPTPEVDEIVGLPKLREYLKSHEDIYVKVSRFRGDFETFSAKNYKLAEPVLDDLEYRLGAKKLIEKFVCFKGIDAVAEVGIDTYCIDGKFPSKTIGGIEAKDKGYGGCVIDFTKMSPLTTDVLHKFAPTLEYHKYRQFISTENRITEDKKSYLIDWTCRLPSPNSELAQEMISNLGEIIWHGANGELIEPKFTAQYGIEIIIRSSWAEKSWAAISYPKEIENFVKLKNCCKIKGQMYTIPVIEMVEIGAVIGIGDSWEAAEKHAKENCEQVQGYKLEMNCDGIVADIMGQFENAKKVGVEFS